MAARGRGKGVEGGRGQRLGRNTRRAARAAVKEGKDDSSSEEDNSESDGEPELPEVIGENLNLSKKKLRIFPEELLDKMEDVQFLYLEGNKLTELPEDFFLKLPCLKWLDLRNNSLNALPSAGLERHKSLEVILLQGNRIRILPDELSTIPTLKGLQTTGNPITNVPYEVLAKGFQSVMDHLEKIRTQEDILFPVSDAFFLQASTSRGEAGDEGYLGKEPEYDMRIWDSDKLSQWRHFIKKKTEDLKESVYQEEAPKCVKEKQIAPKISVSVRSQPKVQPFRCGVYTRNKHKAVLASALRYLKMRKTRLGYKRKPITAEMIQEKAKFEAYRAQVREVLELQAKKIQRMRDKELLKNWRNHSRMTQEQIKLLDNYQKYPSKNFTDITPFDVDPEFLSMLNREDLYKSLKDYDNRSKRKRKPRTRITALWKVNHPMNKKKFIEHDKLGLETRIEHLMIVLKKKTQMDLEMQINEIVKKLRALDTEDAGYTGEDSSSMNKQSHMCSKMDKIMDIQKSLKNLQKLNSTIITPVVKAPPKE